MPERRLNILMLLPELQVGGVETHVVNLSRGLTGLGHRVIVVSNGGGLVPSLKDAGVEHRQLPVHRKSLLSILSMIPKIRHLIRQEKIDVVHAHSRVPAWISFFAKRGTLDTVFLITAHGKYGPHLGSKVVGWGDRVIAVSGAVRDHLTRELGVPGDKIQVIYNGIDTDLIEASAPEDGIRAVKTQWGLDGRFVIGTVSRFTVLKGLNYLIEAAPRILNSAPDARFLMVGDGPQRRALERQAAALGIEDKVLFTGIQRTVPLFYRAMDLFVVPSLTEGMGLSTMEAMSLGVPVIGSRVDGLQELLSARGGVGVTMEPGNVEELSARVLELYRDRDRRLALGLKSADYIKEQFSIGSMVRGIEAAYLDAMRRKGLLGRRPLRILQMIPELKVGGNERGVMDLSLALRRRGHEVSIISNGGRLVDDLEGTGVNHYKMPVHSKSPLVGLLLIPKIRKFIKRNRIDVIDVHSRVPAWISFFASRRSRTRFLTTAHGDYRNHLGSRVMGYGDTVIAISSMIRDRMINMFSVPEDRIRVVPRWVNFQEFDQARARQQADQFAREFALEGKRSVALVGRLTEWKGHRQFIEAAAMTLKTRPDTLFFIVGESQGRTAYENSLRQLALELGVQDRVIFTGYRSDIPGILTAVNVLVHASTSPEPFGRVVIEAMAMGRPVIATRAGGILDIITDNVDGILVEPGDSKAIADAVTKVLDNPEWSEKIGLAARECVGAKFGLDKMVALTEEIYYETLGM